MDFLASIDGEKNKKTLTFQNDIRLSGLGNYYDLNGTLWDIRFIFGKELHVERLSNFQLTEASDE